MLQEDFVALVGSLGVGFLLGAGAFALHRASTADGPRDFLIAVGCMAGIGLLSISSYIFLRLDRQAPANATVPVRPISSRLFAGPSQYPPQDFMAYGIVAFPARATTGDRARHMAICEGYAAALVHFTEASVPIYEQMVTIWPIDGDDRARAVNRMPRPQVCAQAVDQYGLAVAQKAIADAEMTGLKIAGLGPFVFAWSPSASKGKSDALILHADLSYIQSDEDAKLFFTKWSDEIQNDPTVWTDTWNEPDLRTYLRRFVDEKGEQILSLFKGR